MQWNPFTHPKTSLICREPRSNALNLLAPVWRKGVRIEYAEVRRNGQKARVLAGVRSRTRSTGFIVWQEYDTSNSSFTDATVEVDTPHGQLSPRPSTSPDYAEALSEYLWAVRRKRLASNRPS